MDKEQWQNLYNLFDRTHSDFLLAYPQYRNGKNQKIRDTATREMDNAIRTADFNIRRNKEVYELITGGENVSDYGRTIIYEEFTRYNYFGDDMAKLLVLIKDKISQFK
ncbi:hypothetical protein SAMN05444143_1284 [Flavobacterium succinicans]|uniref:Four helix bundle protein n=1 Tax=Flavobacterium succinicans TaxID=29536 RepID=A0A1I5A778_9FLAO|nr:hypothetical protein [Flavobacterium succinicans]SFN58286.1 hypothetical protein SAMN05444143_1284 [Flavobacterium succinicans]